MSRGRTAAGVAWLITAVYYFYQYTLRSAPAVMMLLTVLLTIVLKETGAAARAKAPVVEETP